MSVGQTSKYQEASANSEFQKKLREAYATFSQVEMEISNAQNEKTMNGDHCTKLLQTYLDSL